MPVLETAIDPRSEDFVANAQSLRAQVGALKDLLAKKAAPAITSAAGTPAAAGAAVPAGDSNTKPAGNEVVVQMHEVPGSAGANFLYEPANLTIKVGTTVKWINVSGEEGPRHTSTAPPPF